MFVEKTFDTGNIVLNFVEGPPSGPPLMLLHGSTGRWQDFLSIIPALSVHWHIYALDFRGFGKSGWLSGQYRLMDYVADTRTFLESHLSEPAVIFGYSLGGWVALMLAAQCPTAIKALVIGDSPLYHLELREAHQTSIPFIRALQDLAHSKGPVEDLVPPLAELYGDSMDTLDLRYRAKGLIQQDPDTLSAWVQGYEDIDAYQVLWSDYTESELFPMISCPVLLIQGNPSHGGMMTERDVHRAMGLFPQVVHVRLENAGHGLGLDTFEVHPLLRAMMTFLEAL